MNKHYKGFSFEEVGSIQAGDTILLDGCGVLTVIDRNFPSMKKGGKEIQKSMMVRLEDGREVLLIVAAAKPTVVFKLNSTLQKALRKPLIFNMAECGSDELIIRGGKLFYCRETTSGNTEEEVNSLEQVREIVSDLRYEIEREEALAKEYVRSPVQQKEFEQLQTVYHELTAIL